MMMADDRALNQFFELVRLCVGHPISHVGTQSLTNSKN